MFDKFSAPIESIYLILYLIRSVFGVMCTGGIEIEMD